MSELILTKNFGVENYHKIDVYLEHGGYEGLKKAINDMTPEEIVEEVIKSNLVGLGGAGFPAGRKWSFIPKDSPKPKYLVVNADEGEPGTFKDRPLIEKAPHQMLEGMIITSFAVGIHKAFIYIRGEYIKQIRILEQAIEEAHSKGFLGENILGSGFDLDIVVHKGAGAYICGEETGLLESLEGKKGWPRIKPPYFPAVIGLFGCPTVINNVETLSHVPHVIVKGAEWLASMGTERNGGTRLFCLSGHVEKPGIYELPLGTPLREMIYDHAGGIRGGKALKAVVPGGISASILTADEIDVKMDFDSLREAGTMGGSGGVIIMDEDTCMVEALGVVSRFFAHESCGQCTPCREGTGWLEKIMERILAGQGRPQDLDTLLSSARSMMGATICLLADAAAMPTTSYVEKFRDEFDYHIREKKCNLPARQMMGVGG